MRSPFPGMDPFIECFGLWEDFHTKLIGEMERSLSSLVPDRYVVRTGERSYVAIGSSSGDEGHEWQRPTRMSRWPCSRSSGRSMLARITIATLTIESRSDPRLAPPTPRG